MELRARGFSEIRPRACMCVDYILIDVDQIPITFIFENETLAVADSSNVFVVQQTWPPARS